MTGSEHWRCGTEQFGQVDHLNIDAGFGYVLDATGTYRYIFLANRACPWSVFGKLKVAQPVRFFVDEAGRVTGLTHAAATRR